MRGITEERLMQLLDIYSNNTRDGLESALISECQELNPWHPITSDQMNGDEYLVMGDGYVGVAFWDINIWYSHDAGEVNPTHWMELPEPPK